MGRPPRKLPSSNARNARTLGTDEILASLSPIMAPLVRILLASGADFGRFAAQLKTVFIDEARRELVRTGQADTDSAISLMSGVHRKDVRAWRTGVQAERPEREISMTAQVFARWLQDPLYRDRRHQPKTLPRLGGEPSFESLARSVTQDVHPFTVLNDLVRLGLVQIETINNQEFVVPSRSGFVPLSDTKEMINLFSDNLADHASTAVENLLGEAPRLEQSVFADGLSADSVKFLNDIARNLWAKARTEMIAQAQARYDADRSEPDATHRMRFGAYFWNEDYPPAHDAEEKKGK